MAGAEFPSVGLLIRQLEQKAAEFRELAQPLNSRLLLAPVRRLAQDPATWRGDIKTVFGGWLDLFESWIQNSLGAPLDDLATRLEHHIGEIKDMAGHARMGMCPAPPDPMGPIRSAPGGLPPFDLKLPRSPREQVSMGPDAMRSLAKALSGAHEAVKAHERKLRDALVPVIMPRADPTIDLGPASAHLPPDAADAVGQPKWYLAVAVELDKARVEVLNRATKWEDATRTTDGRVSAPLMAGLTSSLQALKARAAQRAATGHLSPFASPARAGPSAPPTARDRRRQAESDAKRVMDKLRSGFFDFQDRKGAENVLGRAAKAAAASSEYAAAFLKKLGPKGLRKLLDEGMDPCLVSEVVARASMAGVDIELLKDALGKNRADKPARAAQLAACNCPNGTLHPAWAEYLVTTLYEAPDTKPLDPADPRRWYRQAAANVIREHLARPPAGKEPEADDVLERIAVYAATHELDPAGKRGLATALAARGTFDELASVLVPGELAGGDYSRSFDPPRANLMLVLPDLMADPEARRTVLAAAESYAALKVAAAAAAPLEEREGAMAAVGALFGALASRPYSMQAAADIRKAAEKSVLGLVESAGGKLLEAATKGLPGVALAIEGGKAIIFDIAGESSDLRAKEREIKGDRQRVVLQEQLRTELQAEIKHLTYVAVLSDPGRRQELELLLSPESVPNLSPNEMERIGLGRTTREQWRDALFDGDGRLRVPAPSDGRRWTMFLRWAERANPSLRFEVDGLADKAYNAMNSVRSS